VVLISVRVAISLKLWTVFFFGEGEGGCEGQRVKRGLGQPFLFIKTKIIQAYSRMWNLDISVCNNGSGMLFQLTL
jgi:hypothetical protein